MQIKRVKSNEDFTKEKQNLGKIIEFFSKTNDLQKTQRYGDYPDFSESTADHTFKVVLIVDYLYKYLNLDLDYQKCIELAIYHDFGEIDLKQDVDIKGNAQTRIKRIRPNVSKWWSIANGATNTLCIKKPNNFEWLKLGCEHGQGEA